MGRENRSRASFRRQAGMGLHATKPQGGRKDEKSPPSSEEEAPMKRLPQLFERPSLIPEHPEGDVPVIEAVVRHIERHVGPIDFVLHEKRSHLVHIDIHHVPPAPGRRFHTLLTSGMSARAMTVPAGAEDVAYAELFL